MKFRAGERFGRGEESIDGEKRRRLRRAASAYRERAFPSGPKPPVRFDVAIVTPSPAGDFDVEIRRDAFE